MFYVGLDIHDKRIAICILGETGLLRVRRLRAAWVGMGRLGEGLALEGQRRASVSHPRNEGGSDPDREDRPHHRAVPPDDLSGAESGNSVEGLTPGKAAGVIAVLHRRGRCARVRQCRVFCKMRIVDIPG
jgi:hypothetical protein